MQQDNNYTVENVNWDDWPWIDAVPVIPSMMPDGSPWPRISIVTPSFNQAQYIEETIRSVLLQNYPNLEYIIIDGGSTDGSVEIIKKYEPWLTFWVSEPDRGQSHAINKGFAKSTGEIMAWINSDDYYAPGTFFAIASLARDNPGSQWYAGTCFYIKPDGRVTEQVLIPLDTTNGELWLVKSHLMQPSVFWHRSLWNQSGSLDESLQFSFDYELWLRFAYYQIFPTCLNQPISYFRFHPTSKTVKNQKRFISENKILWSRHSQLAKHLSQKFRVWRFRKEHETRRQLRSSTGYFDMIKVILSIAPWLMINYAKQFVINRFHKIFKKNSSSPHKFGELLW